MMNVSLKAFLLTCLAMIAFAANSVLARLALLTPEIGPVSFTLIRLFAGIVVLAVLVGPLKSWRAGSWSGGTALLMYAGFFSLAYISLPAGIGALILFAAVQMTMVGAGLIRGEKMLPIQIGGAAFAFLGLVFLLNPGQDAPSVIGSILMISSGIGWGLYSLKGQSARHPTQETSGNFVKAGVLASLFFIPYLALNPESEPQMVGIGLAILSGAVTSGLGYVIWYAALPHLSAIRAGLAQLTVPAIAALGGVVFLSEVVTSRLVISSIVILIGVAIATLPSKNG